MFMDNLKEQDMKKIVRGNDFTLRIPVKKIVNGEQVSFPLTDCTDIAVHVVSKYKRTALPYTIDKESNDVLLADVDGTTLSLGTYALEVTGVSEGANWRSYEYEQFAIVDNNASSDTVFEDNTTDGDTNIEDGNGDNANKGCMDVKIEGFAVDTALVVLPPVSSRTTSSVKKSKPKIEYVVGRAIKCSLLTLSSSDRVRYIVPNNDKMISLLVGNKTSSLLAKKGDSIKVKFIINGPIPLLGWVEPVRTHYYSVSPGRNDEIEIILSLWGTIYLTLSDDDKVSNEHFIALPTTYSIFGLLFLTLGVVREDTGGRTTSAVSTAKPSIFTSMQPLLTLSPLPSSMLVLPSAVLSSNTVSLLALLSTMANCSYS